MAKIIIPLEFAQLRGREGGNSLTGLKSLWRQDVENSDFTSAPDMDVRCSLGPRVIFPSAGI
jgi:hypothetical protein